MRATDSLINTSNKDIHAVVPRLIDAGVTIFDGRSDSRRGLSASQLNRVVDHIETHLEPLSQLALALTANMKVT